MDYDKAIRILGFRTFTDDAKSLQKLKKKYRALAKKYHPDTGGSEDKFKELGAAHAFLLNFAGKSRPSPPPEPVAESTFSDFCSYLASHSRAPLKRMFADLNIDETTLLQWLNMAADLSYVANCSGVVEVLYIPPGLTIGRFYFSHAVRTSGGFKGNEAYQEAEDRYRRTWKI